MHSSDDTPRRTCTAEEAAQIVAIQAMIDKMQGQAANAQGQAAKAPLNFTVPPYFRTRWGGTTSYHRVIDRPSFGEWTGVVCEVLSVSVEEHGLRFTDEVRATAEADMSRDIEAIEADEWHEIVANYVKPRST